MDKTEKLSLQGVKAVADIYGYGNIIAFLKRGWAEKLKESGLDENTALRAADTSAYYKAAYDDIMNEKV